MRGQQTLWAPIPELLYDWETLEILTESTIPGLDITAPLSIAPSMLTRQNLTMLRDAAHSQLEETTYTPSQGMASGNASSVYSLKNQPNNPMR